MMCLRHMGLQALPLEEDLAFPAHEGSHSSAGKGWGVPLCSCLFAGLLCPQDTVFINNEAKVLSSDIISTNGVIHVIDKLLSPKNLLITPKDALGRVLVGNPLSPFHSCCLCRPPSSDVWWEASLLKPCDPVASSLAGISRQRLL